MTPIYVYKLNLTETKPVARLSLSADEKALEIVSSEEGALQALQLSLRQGALVHEHSQGVTEKRMPTSVGEATLARLKRKLPRPYFLSHDAGDVPVKFQATCHLEEMRF